jgi:hypothetical protein
MTPYLTTNWRRASVPTVNRQSASGVGPNHRPGATGVLSRIRPIGFDDEGIKLLLYGRSGTGKTTLWATFPGPILAVVCSGGTKPGELRSVDTPEYRGKIDQVTLRDSGEMKDVLAFLKKGSKYRTAVVDHASGLQDLTLKEVLGWDELPAQKSFGMATMQQYGESTLRTKEILREMLNLSINVVIVAQERRFDDDAPAELIRPTVGAGLSPSLANWLNPACDYVVQTFIRRKTVKKVTPKIGGGQSVSTEPGEGVEYCMRTEPHEVYITKFRVPKGHSLPDVIVDPTYDKLMAVIRGTGTAAKTNQAKPGPTPKPRG